jgi:hypothetical protein
MCFAFNSLLNKETSFSGTQNTLLAAIHLRQRRSFFEPIQLLTQKSDLSAENV